MTQCNWKQKDSAVFYDDEGKFIILLYPVYMGFWSMQWGEYSFRERLFGHYFISTLENMLNEGSMIYLGEL